MTQHWVKPTARILLDYLSDATKGVQLDLSVDRNAGVFTLCVMLTIIQH